MNIVYANGVALYTRSTVMKEITESKLDMGLVDPMNNNTTVKEAESFGAVLAKTINQK